jgi:transposase
VVVYLHYAHAIGMQRLVTLMAELFSLSISEGAISNILARTHAPLLRAAATIEDVVLASPVVCSDETSVRVKGKTCWEWVFVATLAVLHVIRPSRGKAVVRPVRRDPPAGVGLRHAGQPTGPWRPLAGVPRASAA